MPHHYRHTNLLASSSVCVKFSGGLVTVGVSTWRRGWLWGQWCFIAAVRDLSWPFVTK